MSDTAECGDLHDRGLGFDRRRMLTLMGIAGTGALVAGCDLFGPPGHSEPNRVATAADGSTCIKAPAETSGPFPADGSNARHGSTVNVLARSGILRTDLRPSFGGMKPVADGAQFDLVITLVDVAKGCAPLSDHAIYLWHCDASGKYSLYDDEDRNYLRGVAITDAKGQVAFRTIFPGCYSGRWPHIHFEVFASQQKATSGEDSLLISQLAIPGAIAAVLYAGSSLYAASVAYLADISLQKDNVFGDNTAEQIAAQTLDITGDAAGGFRGSVTVGITSGQH
jgi:protocatechuate 3,4-dioxygenase beta subunit